MKRVFTLLFCFLFCISCVFIPDKTKHKRITFKNNSQESVFVTWCVPPYSDLDFQLQVDIYYQHFRDAGKTVLPGQSNTDILKLRDYLENRFSYGYYESEETGSEVTILVAVFILKDLEKMDHAKPADLDYYLYECTLDALINANWTIEFPYNQEGISSKTMTYHYIPEDPFYHESS